MSEVLFAPIIPPELAAHISPEQILDNAGRYPEMQQGLSTGQHLAVTAIKAMLLEIDLTHNTDHAFEDFNHYGILPEQECRRKELHGTVRAMELDKSLGLNQYTFMNVGNFEQNTYGDHIIGIDAKQVLLSPRTIASPKDINEHIFESMYIPVGEMDDIDKKELHTYLRSLVTGRDWLEIISRRFLNTTLKRSTDDIPLLYPRSLGEIKHFGSIPPEYFTAQVHTEDERHEKWKEYIGKGFYTKAVSTAIGRTYWEQPEKLGIDLARPRAMWAKVIELAQS